MTLTLLTVFYNDFFSVYENLITTYTLRSLLNFLWSPCILGGVHLNLYLTKKLSRK